MLLAVLAAVLVGSGGYGIADAGGPGGPGGSGGLPAPATVLGPGAVTVVLQVHHSRFTPAHVRVRPGTEVRFVVVNDDPIGHELIVGGPEVHARHEGGTEATHPPVPGEVSVGPLGLAETTYRFDEPGDVLYACHLPGHFAYGMRGTITISQ